MNEKLKESLENIGLSDKEAAIYSALLELGGAYPSKIAEITKINRSTTYKILLQLSIKGLVNEIEKRNKIFYQIENPNKLINYSKYQVKINEERLEKAKKIAPELWSLFNDLGDKPKVLFFEGSAAVKDMYNDMIETDQKYEMLAFSNAKKVREFLPTLNDFVETKAKIGITTRAIVPDTPEDRKYNTEVFKYIDKKYWPKMKFVDPEKFRPEAEITLYSQNKVAIAKMGGENLIGLIIEDKTIHDMLKAIFELTWASSKE